MDNELTILILKESLKKDYGDYGRTQYVIEKLQRGVSLPKSDHMYIARMIKLCEPVIEEPEESPEVILSSDLIKCYHCNLHIKLDESQLEKIIFGFMINVLKRFPLFKIKFLKRMKQQPK